MSGTSNPCIVDGKCASPTNLPEFIDTNACLCGLLNSKQTDPNGGLSQLWRCIGNASDNIMDGGNGKWYNTMLPSEELSGINEPQNWGENNPDLSQAYVLVDVNGQAAYKKLGSDGNPNLIGADKDCTAKNDTQLTTTFYSHSGNNGSSNGNAASSSSSSSASSVSSISSSSAVASTMPSSSTLASSTTPLSTAGSNTSPSATPSTSKTSSATHTSMKSILLVGVLLAPLFMLMA